MEGKVSISWFDVLRRSSLLRTCTLSDPRSGASRRL